MKAPLHESGAARVEVQIASGPGRTKTLAGILDTGAALCLIPQGLASQLGLVQRTWHRVGSLHRETKEPGYFATLTIPGLFEGTVLMVEMKGDFDFVVVGRSVLASLKLVFDGPRREFELNREA